MSIYDNLFKTRQTKLYDSRRVVKDDRKNIVNNYRDGILMNSVSKYILRNDAMNDFVILIQHVVADLVDSVTYLKAYKSFTVRKGDKKVK